MVDTTPEDTKESSVAKAKTEIPKQEETKNKATGDSVAMPEAVPAEAAVISEPAAQPAKKSAFRFLKTKKGKMTLAVIGGVAIVIAILLAIPTTRYGILGSLIHKDMAVSVIDSKTNRLVSDAEVSVPGTTARTDNNGKATLGKIAVGQYRVMVKKKNYKDASIDVTVPIIGNPGNVQVKFEATGRQVPVVVTNKITGQPLEKVAVVAGEATAITDTKGEATLVVPADATSVKATLKVSGYNDQAVDVTVTEQKDTKNNFGLTPAGKIYFLSKRTGAINVMKSNLDGSNAQVVVQGTGKEDDRGTVLLASRDWRYVALLSRRDSDKPKLYLIATANDKMDVIDEGPVDFALTGWSDHTFIYRVQRQGLKVWQPNQTALKSFDAETSKLTTLDQTIASGSNESNFAYERLDNAYILDDAIVYTKDWNFGSAADMSGKKAIVVSVQPNGVGKKVVKDFDAAKIYLSGAVLYKPGEIYYRLYENGTGKFYEYDEGVVKVAADVSEDSFNGFYPTYLVSPNGQSTLWYEQRDGKNTLFIGDKSGGRGKELASSTEYVPYGWYSEDYVLISKGGSELYIAPAKNSDITKAIKVTDYHKPSVSFNGYGYGYGGF